MEITSAEFITSQSVYQPIAPGVAQIALVGRSNVGKSSLLNCLCNRTRLAKVSGTPGKTRLINYFYINQSFYFVDLPGYGFAKVDKKEKTRWGEMMDNYFRSTRVLRFALMLVDIRHEPTADDVTMADYFRAMKIPFYVVCTKTDKVSRGSRMKYAAPILRALQVQPWQITYCSSQTQDGREELLSKIEVLLFGDDSKQGEM